MIILKQKIYGIEWSPNGNSYLGLWIVGCVFSSRMLIQIGHMSFLQIYTSGIFHIFYFIHRVPKRVVPPFSNHLFPGKPSRKLFKNPTCQVWDGKVICIAMGVAGLVHNYSFELTEDRPWRPYKGGRFHFFFPMLFVDDVKIPIGEGMTSFCWLLFFKLHMILSFKVDQVDQHVGSVFVYWWNIWIFFG